MVDQQIRGRLNPNTIHRRNGAIKEALENADKAVQAVNQIIDDLVDDLRTSVKEIQMEQKLVRLMECRRGPIYDEARSDGKQKEYSDWLKEMKELDKLLTKEAKEFEKEEHCIAREDRVVRRELEDWKKIQVELETVRTQVSTLATNWASVKNTPVKDIREHMEKTKKHAEHAIHKTTYIQRWENRDHKVQNSINRTRTKMEKVVKYIEKAEKEGLKFK